MFVHPKFVFAGSSEEPATLLAHGVVRWLCRCVPALQEHADINPSHTHRYCLARAEQERWRGDRAAAEHHYSLAIDAAEEGRFVQASADPGWAPWVRQGHAIVDVTCARDPWNCLL